MIRKKPKGWKSAEIEIKKLYCFEWKPFVGEWNGKSIKNQSRFHVWKIKMTRKLSDQTMMWCKWVAPFFKSRNTMTSSFNFVPKIFYFNDTKSMKNGGGIG